MALLDLRVDPQWAAREIALRGFTAAELVDAGVFPKVTLYRILKGLRVQQRTARKFNRWLENTPVHPDLAYVANGMR